MAKTISKNWLMKHYIDLNWNAQMCADKRKVTIHIVRGLITKYKIQKWKYKAHKVWNKPKRSKKFYKHTQAVMPHSKPVLIFHKDSDTPIFEEPSITAAAKKIKATREHVRDCLNPNKQRHSTKGFRFMFVKEYYKPQVSTTSDMSMEELVAIAKASIHRDTNIKYI
jgi:hypothetical protein